MREEGDEREIGVEQILYPYHKANTSRMAQRFRLLLSLSILSCARGFPSVPQTRELITMQARQSRLQDCSCKIGRRRVGLVFGISSLGLWRREAEAAFQFRMPDPQIVAEFDPPRDSFTDAALASGK